MELTYKQAREALKDVLRTEGEDTTYAERYLEATGETFRAWSSCKYQVHGKPLCIIGVLFDRLGIPYDQDWEYNDVIEAVGMIDDLHVTKKARKFLQVVQGAQDEGDTWGNSVERGKSYIKTGLD